MDTLSFPFGQTKIPVMYSVTELLRFLQDYSDFWFCLYLAEKDEAAWELSTSRVYMNQVLPHFLYIPVQVKKDDLDTLRVIYEAAQKNPHVVAINQTQPHKSNLVLKELFSKLADVPMNIDVLVKDQSNNLIPYDLNGPSFVHWFDEEVSTLHKQRVLLVGVGGVGEPLARRIIMDAPTELIMVDHVNKEGLRSVLAKYGNVLYFSSLEQVPLDQDIRDLIVINAAGKEGVADYSGTDQLLDRYKYRNFIFVDLRPQLQLEIVERANDLGWRAYTGYGMNARNDYTLLSKIAQFLKWELPSFTVFKQLVAKSS
jgi:hypothetical protein